MVLPSVFNFFENFLFNLDNRIRPFKLEKPRESSLNDGVAIRSTFFRFLLQQWKTNLDHFFVFSGHDWNLNKLKGFISYIFINIFNVLIIRKLFFNFTPFTIYQE